MAGQGTEEKSRSTSDCRETCPRTMDWLRQLSQKPKLLP
jgi:hypothetical protein